jgi:hypothetical protein
VFLEEARVPAAGRAAPAKSGGRQPAASIGDLLIVLSQVEFVIPTAG